THVVSHYASLSSPQTVSLSPTPAYVFVTLSSRPLFPLFFFFNDTATTEIYTLSLHDALPIYILDVLQHRGPGGPRHQVPSRVCRSEEHTSELQSRRDLVCRLLLEKKKIRRRLAGAQRDSHGGMSQVGEERACAVDGTDRAGER